MADILMITAIAGAENCAAVLSKQFQLQVETASTRKEGIAMLRHHTYSLVILDESLIEAGDPPGYDADDALFRHMGTATPVEVNFATSGTGRLVRAVRSSLRRRSHEKSMAAVAAAADLQAEWREVSAGLILQTQLALSVPALPPELRSRLEVIAGLAARLGERYASAQPSEAVARQAMTGVLIPPRAHPPLRRQLPRALSNVEVQDSSLMIPALQPVSQSAAGTRSHG